METIGMRIRKVRKELPSKTTQETFGKALGVSAATITAYELDRATPPPATIRLICLTYHVNQQWLETGEGEPYLHDSDAQLQEAVQNIMAGRNPLDVAVVSALVQMPEEWWTMFRRKLREEMDHAYGAANREWK